MFYSHQISLGSYVRLHLRLDPYNIDNISLYDIVLILIVKKSEKSNVFYSMKVRRVNFTRLILA